MFILIVLILCTIGLYPLAAGVRWESVCSFVMFLTFREVTRLHSLFRCFACCKKKQVTRIQMDIEPYFTELNSLAKYGFNQLFLLIWRRRDAGCCVLSHTLADAWKIFVLFLCQLLEGLGLRRDKRKEIIQCVTWHLDITHYHVMMY